MWTIGDMFPAEVFDEITELAKSGNLDFIEKDFENWKKVKDGYKGVFKTPGINASDISLSTGNKNGDYFINIVGRTELEGSKYNVDLKIVIPNTIHKNIKKILKKTVNGLTIIKLVVESKSEKEIEIEDF